jgi:hypothetical protein
MQGKEYGKNMHIVVVCTGLHSFVGHEFTYTKLVKSVLPVGATFEVWGRKDASDDVRLELPFRAVFSRVNYNQEERLFKKAYSLVKRELAWYREFTAATREVCVADKGRKIVYLLHTFSIYNTWLWLIFARSLYYGESSLAILFRYSSLLLPSILRRPYFWMVRRFPQNNPRIAYLTDSHRLRQEYVENAGLDLNILPVPVDFPPDEALRHKCRSECSRIRISYLGAARSDKGFTKIPKIIRGVLGSEFSARVEFCIQASVSGTGYMESGCHDAMTQLREIKASYPQAMQLIERPLDENEYTEMLRYADIILLPYTGRTYAAQTSGILIEAAAYQAPCVVPQGTWLEDELAVTGAGVAFDPQDPDGALRSTLELLRDFEAYFVKARQGRQLMADRHGLQAFARELNINLAFCVR